MKKLLMLGGGFLQNFVIRKAKSMDYYVLYLDADPNALVVKNVIDKAIVGGITAKIFA